MTDELELLLTAEQAAAILHVHRATVLRFVHAGLLKPALRGPGRTGVYLFRPTSVEAVARARAGKSKGA